jgi:hypothetical protein
MKRPHGIVQVYKKSYLALDLERRFFEAKRIGNQTEADNLYKKLLIAGHKRGTRYEVIV